MILSSSRHILEKDGISGLSARAIAKQIGYSPGTLYNVFKNLDDLVLTIEGELLQEGLIALRAVPRHGKPDERLRALAECHIAFALKNRRLWNVLFQHSPSVAPSELAGVNGALEAMREEFREAVAQLMHARHPDEAERLASGVWYSIHGISSIAVSEKVLDIEPAQAAGYVAIMIDAAIAMAKQR